MTPSVTLKLATSIDGRIATASGESRWITGAEARAEVHRMRAAAAAVIVGIGTARADDPELTARTDPPPARQPLRVVLDGGFSLSPNSRLVATMDQAPLLVIGRSGADAGALRERGVEVLALSGGADGIALPEALAAIAERAGPSLFVEGGRRLSGALLRAGLIDRLEWFRAPLLLGEEGVSAVGALAVGGLADAPRYRRVALRELGPDLWESYERA